MYDTILVPTDGSAAAETASTTALALAQRFGASLHAINVVELGGVPADVEGTATDELTRYGQETLAALENRATDAGVPVTTRVAETAEPTHQAIVDYATDHDADLVVMGTHGRTGLNRLVLGSVTERTLRTSPAPVLTVHEDATFDPDVETVLVPTDGSAAANAAADHAIALAAATGAAMHVAHVVDHTAASGEAANTGVLTALEEAGRRAVEDVISRAEDADVRSVEASVLSGTPASAILDYADDRDIDLVVAGTHGRTGLDRYLLGSVTEKLVRVADAPVLSVPGPDEH